MEIIKNKEELAKLVNADQDLIFDEDIKIEYQVEKGELRDVKCRNLFLMNDDELFDFTGRNFTGWNFTGRDFNGKKVSYYAFFNCYGSIKCDEIKGRREPCNPPVSLDGKIEIKK